MINLYEAIISDPHYFKQLSVGDSLLVNYQCPQIAEWAELYSHFNIIIYTISGKKTLKTPGNSRTLTEQSLVFLKKGAVWQGKFFDQDWRVIVFCVPDSYLQKSLKEYRQQAPFIPAGRPDTDTIIDISATQLTHSYFYSLLPYFTQQPPPPENLLELKCRELIFSIFSNPDNSALLSYLNNLSDCSKPLLHEIMEANYRFNLSLKEFAQISHRSLTAFKSEFTSIFHTSPGKWLLQKRLDYAMLQLPVATKNISEIVYESGFESPTHFSRVFKAKFGVAPLQYRKQQGIS